MESKLEGSGGMGWGCGVWLWEAFVNWLRYADWWYSEDMIPTVRFNMKKVTKGNVTTKLWDLGGQPRFHSMWERYCRAVSAFVYVVDAADYDNLPVSRSELYDLLSEPSLNGIPCWFWIIRSTSQGLPLSKT